MESLSLALGISCFTFVSIFPIIHQFSVDMKCAGVLHGYKQAQVVVSSTSFHGDFEGTPGAYLLSGTMHVFLKDFFPCQFLAGKGSSELHQRTREYWSVLNLSRDNCYPVLSGFFLFFFSQLQSRGRCPPRLKQEDRSIKTSVFAKELSRWV